MQASICDAITTERDELLGTLHLRGQPVDVDVAAFEFGQDAFELTDRSCVSVGDRFAGAAQGPEVLDGLLMTWCPR